MKKQPEISSADEALFAIADLLKKEGNIDELALVCAEALMANDIHQSSFAELLEKYQIREKHFAEELAKQAMELRQIHDAHILRVRDEFVANSNVLIDESSKAFKPERVASFLNKFIPKLLLKQAKNTTSPQVLDAESYQQISESIKAETISRATKAGIASSEQRKKVADEKSLKIYADTELLMKMGTVKHNVAANLAKKYNCSAKNIRESIVRAKTLLKEKQTRT
jgi:Mor family transcriptional regulator